MIDGDGMFSWFVYECCLYVALDGKVPPTCGLNLSKRRRNNMSMPNAFITKGPCPHVDFGGTSTTIGAIIDQF